MSIHKVESSYAVIVVGGGMAGVCAAIASAKGGSRTAIVQNRSVFGGNASSEIRMHIVGANCHSSKPNLRETGIVEEILLDNKQRNPYASFPVFDSILWEKVCRQEHLTAFLNTNMDDVILENRKIQGIICHQNTTETEFRLYGKIFIDATGHGTLGVMAGADSRMGSEGRVEFGEPTAPEEPNSDTMGNTMMFTAVDRGEPVKFICPEWAYQFSEEDLRYRPHVTGTTSHADGGEIVTMEEGKNQLPGFTSVDSGYWWIELGGQYDDIIREGEKIRDELLKCVYGVWDHMKNVGNHGLQNYDLDWIGMVPGYRESRRLEGGYLLTENDIRENRIFEDAVAYGGWPMDNHVRGGILDFTQYPSQVYNFEGCYTIPYSCYYSKDVDNLMMAGRNISTSKMAFSSTRVMGTCAIGGQAVGTAAAMAIRNNCSPWQVGALYIKELQQQLLKDDCYIPGLINQDEQDLARTAVIRASSEKEPANQVMNGIARSTGECTNYWESQGITKDGERLEVYLCRPAPVHQVRLVFDTDLNHEIMPSMTRLVMDRQVKGMPAELIKDYQVSLLREGEVVAETIVRENRQRLNVLDFEGICTDEVRITIQATHGFENARIYEVRIY